MARAEWLGDFCSPFSQGERRCTPNCARYFRLLCWPPQRLSAQRKRKRPRRSPAPQPPEAKPDYTITGNFGIYSQYIFRGLTQTDQKPAFQGGFDYAHTNGIYLGTWGSNISWLHDAGVVQSRLQPRMGLLRRLEVRDQRRLGHRHRSALLLLPGQLCRRRHQAGHDRDLWRRYRGNGCRSSTPTASITRSACRTPPDTLTCRRTIRSTMRGRSTPTSAARTTRAAPTASATTSSTTPTGSLA